MEIKKSPKADLEKGKTTSLLMVWLLVLLFCSLHSNGVTEM